MSEPTLPCAQPRIGQQILPGNIGLLRSRIKPRLRAGRRVRRLCRAGYSPGMCSWARTSSPASRCSFTRTALLTGSTYVPVLLSGKIDVCHELPPTVTATRTEPKARRIPAPRSVISALLPAGRDTKCQPPGPGYSHSGPANSKLPTDVTGRDYGLR